MNKECVRGTSCGRSCIAKGKICEKGLSPAVGKVLDTFSLPVSGEAYRKQELDKRRAALVDLVGEETVSRAEAQVKGRLQSFSNSLAIRVPKEKIDTILREGFKNQFEVGESRGLSDGNLRRKTEQETLGIPLDSEGSDRPIYGYLSDFGFEKGNASDYVDMYGEVMVNLSKDYKNSKATITGGDSIMEGNYVGSTLNEFNIASLFSYENGAISSKYPSEGQYSVRNMLETLANKPVYADTVTEVLGTGFLEAQIMGDQRPTLKDIKSVLLPGGEASLDPSTRKFLRENRITVSKR